MEPLLGEIKMFAGTFAPNGWFFCDGSQLPISQYSAFFAIIGTTYGGDGVRTFALPDLRGRTAIHSGNGQGPSVSRYQLGQIGGTENVTISSQQMPAHSHIINCASTADQATPGTFYPAASSDPALGTPINTYNSTTDSQMNPAALTQAGGNQPLNIVTPYLGMNFIIAWTGVFPSRP